MGSSQIRTDLLAGAAGVIALLVVLFALRLPFWVAVPAAIIVYIAARLLTPAPAEVAPGISKAQFRQTLRDGSDRIARIRQLAASVTNRGVQSRVLRIASIADDIYADLKQDPKDMNQVPDFAITYLDPLVNVLDRYTRLSAHKTASGSDDTLRKIEDDLLPKVETTFSGVYKQLVNDDVVDLDAASEGLKSLLDLGSV